MSRCLHIVPNVDDIANGMAVVARLLAGEQGDAEVVDLVHGMHGIRGSDVEEVWVHGMWLPREWRVCCAVLRSGKRLVRMTHGSLSPVYLTQQSPLKKKFVSPVERYFLRQADKVVATCEAEAEWIRAYERRVKGVEVTDIKRFFKLELRSLPAMREVRMPLHILYLGRRHPLKGLDSLMDALWVLQGSLAYEFRVVGKALGEEKERVWSWCDVLVLPTLSDNFGLVVAEALEHGKRVITTDGAPAWGDGNTYGGRLVYLRGFRDGTPEARIGLLKEALEKVAQGGW